MWGAILAADADGFPWQGQLGLGAMAMGLLWLLLRTTLPKLAETLLSGFRAECEVQRLSDTAERKLDRETFTINVDRAEKRADDLQQLLREVLTGRGTPTPPETKAINLLAMMLGRLRLIALSCRSRRQPETTS